MQAGWTVRYRGVAFVLRRHDALLDGLRILLASTVRVALDLHVHAAQIRREQRGIDVPALISRVLRNRPGEWADGLRCVCDRVREIIRRAVSSKRKLPGTARQRERTWERDAGRNITENILQAE